MQHQIVQYLNDRQNFDFIGSTFWRSFNSLISSFACWWFPSTASFWTMVSSWKKWFVKLWKTRSIKSLCLKLCAALTVSKIQTWKQHLKLVRLVQLLCYIQYLIYRHFYKYSPWVIFFFKKNHANIISFEHLTITFYYWNNHAAESIKLIFPLKLKSTDDLIKRNSPISFLMIEVSVGKHFSDFPIGALLPSKLGKICHTSFVIWSYDHIKTTLNFI